MTGTHPSVYTPREYTQTRSPHCQRTMDRAWTKFMPTGEIEEGEYCSEATKKKQHTKGPPSCALCNNDKAPFQCSQCKSTHYCGVSCQKLDWKAHKKVCNGVVKKKDGNVA